MRRFLPLLLLPLALTACGKPHARPNTTLPIHTGTLPPPPLPTTSSSTTSPEPTVPLGTVTLKIYFLRDGKLAAAGRTVPATQAVGSAALKALSQGPTMQERAAGLRSAVPHDIHPGLSVSNGLATIEPMQYSEAAVAQFVYTLTQFPTVHAVEIGTVGKHFSRASLQRYVPPILVESPTVDQTVTSPLQLSGTANTFEGSLEAELRFGGRLLLKKTVKASSGTGTRGAFAASIPFRILTGEGLSPMGVLRVYAVSPANGKPTDVVRIPVRVKRR